MEVNKWQCETRVSAEEQYIERNAMWKRREVKSCKWRFFISTGSSAVFSEAIPHRFRVNWRKWKNARKREPGERKGSEEVREKGKNIQKWRDGGKRKGGMRPGRGNENKELEE